jgi:hypothetical protein
MLIHPDVTLDRVTEALERALVKFAIDYTADLSRPENRLPKPAETKKPRRS